MPSLILKQFSKPESFSDLQSNVVELSPNSYSEWLNKNYGISGENSEDQYNKYLKEWYSKKEDNIQHHSLKKDYKQLLKSLFVVFKDDTEFRKLSTLNLDDDLQLKIALPYYVKKLKEIALYYRDRREAIKRAKLKYNMIGSFNSIERTFYDYILKAFSKRDYVLNVPSQSAWNMFPELSSINKGFTIEIEELYDDSDYFEESEDHGESYPLKSNNPLLEILKDMEEMDISEFNFKNLIQANDFYTSGKKFYLSGGYFENDEKYIELDFEEGNNFFYWFSGGNIDSAPHSMFEPIYINDINWLESGATAGTEPSSSDIIFVDYNGNIKGAWFSETNSDFVSGDMIVNLRNNKEFKYPFPGIGTSAIGLDWTGKSIVEYKDYDKTFFPDQSIKDKVEKEIKKIYWNDNSSVSSVNPISIHNTTLIDDGAFASVRFHLADKIITRPENNDYDSRVYSGIQNVDWLYDFKKTNLPILHGSNNIYWPIQRYETTNELTKLKYIWGEEIQINSLPIGTFYGAVAGETIDKSDIIYKINSKCGEPDEAAWLYGTPLTIFNKCGESTSSEFTLDFPEEIKNIPFTPRSIPSLRAWWDSKIVRIKEIEKGEPWHVMSWVDVISKNIFSVVNKKSRPKSWPRAEFISFNTRYNPNVKMVNEKAGMVTNLKRNIPAPFTISFAFSIIRTQSGIVHTILDKAIRNKASSITISIKNRKLEIKSGNTILRSSNNIRGVNQWNYCILTINGANSKLTLNGIDRAGRLKNNSLTKFIIGQTVEEDNQFIGLLRDIMIFNKPLSLQHWNSLKTFMNTSYMSAKITFPNLTKAQIKELAKDNDLLMDYENQYGDFQSGSIQPGVSIISKPNKTNRFIWTGNGGIGGEDNINEQNISGFLGHHHEKSCPYFNIPDTNRENLNNPIKNTQWKSCSCGAINNSPFGHTGEYYRDGANNGDYIIMDTTYPLNVSLENWIGSDGLPWSSSKDFAWFKLDEGQVDGNIGWGKGKWVTNYGDDFKLVAGRMYIYYRGGPSIDCEIETEIVPSFILNQAYCGCKYINCDCIVSDCNPIWKKAIFIDGNWVQTDEPSELTLSPDNYYKYIHRDKVFFSMVSNSAAEVKEDCYDSGEFLLTVNIENLKPYWAKGDYENNEYTINKTIMYGGETNNIQINGLKSTQPIPSSLILTNNMYVRYERNEKCSTDCFVWTQPLNFNIKTKKLAWKKLIIDNCIKSNILSITTSIPCQTCIDINKKCQSCCEDEEKCSCLLSNCIITNSGVTASNEVSDIIFKTRHDSKPVFINYYAQDKFTLPLTVIDNTNGIAPFGGVWKDEVFVDFSSPKFPWRNPTSLFSPYIAYKESKNLYTYKDCGIFTPNRLGATEVYLKNKTIGLKGVDERDSNSFDLVLDTNHYISGPYAVIRTDSTWMKYKTKCLSGFIKNPRPYQTFSPYQTNYEDSGHNQYGILTQTDGFSPYDKTLPKNIKGETSIYCGGEAWFNNIPEISGNIYNWKTDVYGNQFGLYKPNLSNNIWELEQEYGKLWIKTLSGKIGDVSEIMYDVIDSYVLSEESLSAIQNYGILDIDMFYDTLFIKLNDKLIFERLNFDYSKDLIYSTPDKSLVVDYDLFLGYWFDEKEKRIIYSVFKNNTTYIYDFKLKSFTNNLIIQTDNLNYNQLLLNCENDSKLCQNVDTLNYNVTFTSNLSGGVLTNLIFGVSNFGNYEIKEIQIISNSNLQNKKLIKTTSYDNRLLLIFEEQTDPNVIYQIAIDN